MPTTWCQPLLSSPLGEGGCLLSPRVDYASNPLPRAQRAGGDSYPQSGHPTVCAAGGCLKSQVPQGPVAASAHCSGLSRHFLRLTVRSGQTKPACYKCHCRSCLQASAHTTPAVSNPNSESSNPYGLSADISPPPHHQEACAGLSSPSRASLHPCSLHLHAPASLTGSQAVWGKRLLLVQIEPAVPPRLPGNEQVLRE